MADPLATGSPGRLRDDLGALPGPGGVPLLRLGDAERLTALAAACAEEVVVPADTGRCAFAGDRGMLHPEPTAAATAREATEVSGREFDAYLSANRMCEIGMDRATGRPYRSVLLELERATRP